VLVDQLTSDAIYVIVALIWLVPDQQIDTTLPAEPEAVLLG
jgi:hypothetical protein